ncbi:MAG TPA: hypothetical protein VM369_04710 [Candidatus Binatia bacterium]|nr:hypothetical protein [Candidatus Binatia bacterium]
MQKLLLSQAPQLRRLLSGALLLALAFPPCLRAMSYLPVADASLVERSPLIVLGEVTPVPGDADADAAHYQLRVDEVLKGALTQSSVGLRVPGAADGLRAGALVVPGAPRFAEAERVLLFLVRRADGEYEVADLAQGAFHQRTGADGAPVLVRQLDGAEALGGGDTQAKAEAAGLVRDLGRFRAWVLGASSGAAVATDYWSAAPPPADARKFATSGSPPARWFEFDEGRSVTLYAGVADQVGLAGGGRIEFQQALQAWNNDPGSRVLLAYGGVTTAAAGLGSRDGVSQILFNDPRGDLAGTFDCAHGGILAVGMWRSSGVRQSNGRSFQAIVEGDIVVQDGAGCALSSLTRAGVETFAHEVGHLLGLAHSCGDDGQAACGAGSAQDAALMRPTLHADGRGAALGADDRAGIAFLYPQPGSTTAPAQAPSSPDVAAAAAPVSGGGGGAFAPWVVILLLVGRGLRRSYKS